MTADALPGMGDTPTRLSREGTSMHDQSIGTIDGAEPATVQEPTPVAAVKPRRNHRSAKNAGTKFETLMAGWFATRLGDDRIERRTKNGARDRGDLTGIRTIRGGRVVAELKDYAGAVKVKPWLDEAEVERANDDALIGVVIVKRARVAEPSEQLVMMTAETFAVLLEGGVDL